MIESNRSRIGLLVLTLLFTLLNSFKPLHIDDAAYWYYARQMASEPLDPYGFTMHWYTYPQTANEVLAPPVLPAWWGLGIKLFGNRPILWKLWLFPFCLLFTTSLYFLFRRFAPGTEDAMTWMVTLSPIFLPSLNLMLDIPALALGLTALNVFFVACEGGQTVLGVAAGLIAGLAIETKYTAFVVPCVMLLYAMQRNQMAVGVAGICTAGWVFLCWELLVRGWYEESHFVTALQQGGGVNKLALAGPFVMLQGGIGAPILFLALAALYGRRWLIVLAAGLVVAAFVTLLFLPQGWMCEGRWLRPEDPIFFALGCLVLSTLGWATWKLCKPLRWAVRGPTQASDFLILWLLVELAAYFVLSPFAAVRRLMGFEIVAFLILARMTTFTCRTPSRKASIRCGVVFTVLLGFAYWGVDLREAFAAKFAAESAVRNIREQDRNGTIWYVGHWDFQYHMERLGAHAVIPRYPPRSDTYLSLPSPTVFRKGDWIVRPDRGVNQQDFDFDMNHLEEMPGEIEVEDAIPWRTVIYFYGGAIPIRHHQGPRLGVKLYRVKQSFTAQTGTEP